MKAVTNIPTMSPVPEVHRHRPRTTFAVRPFMARLALLALLLVAANVQAQNVEDGYAPEVFGGAVYAVVTQPDGKTLIGGHLSTVNGQSCIIICRLLPDGSVDPTFTSPVPQDYVQTIAVQADGKILIGGRFTAVGGQPRHGAARLHANGSLDTSFGDPKIGGGSPDTTVYALLTQQGGKILVAGRFNTADGQTRTSLARLHSNGSLDSSFPDIGVVGIIQALGQQADGKLLIAGGFLIPVGDDLVYRVARLHADGGIDSSFADSGLRDGFVRAMVVRQDGKIMIGNDFSYSTSPARANLLRLNANGSRDHTFSELVMTNPDGMASILSMAWQPDGRLAFSGGFTQIDGQPHGMVARLNVDGSVDSSFHVETNGLSVLSLAVQADGKTLVGGGFHTMGGQARRNLARLNGDGSVDSNMDSRGDDISGSVTTTALQPDGKVLVVEYLRAGQDSWSFHITRLNFDGRPDPTFVDPAPDNWVAGLAVQADGKVLVSGWFDHIAGQPRDGLARLNTDGSLDTGFSFDGGPGVRSLAVLPDGKILVFGYIYGISGQSVEMLARLNPDGGLDTSFVPSAITRLMFDLGNTVAVQADGKIVIAGAFSAVGGQPRSGLARLHSDGSLDSTFVPASGVIASSMLALLPDGKLLRGGTQGLVRQNVDGSVDASFTGPGSSVDVHSFTVQTDGKIVFASGDGYQDWLLRLNANGTPDNSFAHWRRLQ